MINTNKLFPYFLWQCFLKEIENMFSMFLSSYRNTRESLRVLEKAVGLARVPTAFLILPNVHLCFSTETPFMCSIS